MKVQNFVARVIFFALFLSFQLLFRRQLAHERLNVDPNQPITNNTFLHKLLKVGWWMILTPFCQK